MANPYFLTRQTANLMEDFARELDAGSALYLLYGEPGVGKSRLLVELQRSRLADKRVHRIDLANLRLDVENVDLCREIEQLFRRAGRGDIIVADHFELALKKTRHQLFLSWSTDGVDRGLNLVVASDLEGFNELRQMSQQYQVPVQTYQLMPLDGAESEAFLGQYLFPDHPLGKLTMPAPLRQQIADTRGVIASLIEIADHDGSHIETAPLADAESIRSGGRVIAAVLLLFVLAAGIGWFWFAEPESPLVGIPLEPAPSMTDEAEAASATAAAAESSPGAPAEPAPVELAAAIADGAEAGTRTDARSFDADEPEVVSEATEADEPEVVSEATDEDEPDAAVRENSASVAETFAAIAAGPAPTQGAAAAGYAGPIVDQTIDASATALSLDPEPAPESVTDALPERATIVTAAAASPRTIVSAAGGVHVRLALELERSLDWLEGRVDGVGTIQILLLSVAGFDADTYFEYVDRLARQGVDPDELRIFKTFTGGTVVYSVFYGEYESRRAALRAIDTLPRALRENGPIPRSVGGIREEIRRLPDGN